MPRRHGESDVSIDRYEERRSDYRGNGRGRDYDDRYYDEAVDYRRAPVREREVRVREEVRIKDRSRSRERDHGPPEFLREDPRAAAGPMVLRKRDVEEFEFVQKPRRRSPSPEPIREQVREREEIIIRRDESERPPPRRERDIEREEIIIRRDESERPPPRREREVEREQIIIRKDDRDRDREEIIIRKDERERDRRPPPRDTDREEIIIRRDEGGGRSRYDDDVISHRGGDRRGGRSDYNHEEIIIRRDEREDDTRSRYGGRGYDDYALAPRPKSHERERSRVGRASSHSSHDDEVIIRRDTREGRDGREREREEIIIRKHSHSRSRSPSPVSLPEPPIIRAPPIHQEVITHHRHIDHGFEIARSRAVSRAREISRPPSPPMPPRARSEERIEIKRSGERNGRHYDEDIVIKRNDNDDARSVAPPRSVRGDDDFVASPRRGGYRDRGFDRDDRDEAEYYNAKALERSFPGEAYHGATQDWAIVDVPPGTRKVAMDGAGGGRQEITWQKYNGVRRSKFMPEGSDEGYGSEVGRPARPEAGGGEIGRRYGPRRDPTEGLWTEITKDLVVREAITEAGYEFTETEDFYYVIAYLGYVSFAPPSPFPSSWKSITDLAPHRTMSPASSVSPMISAKRDADERRTWSMKTATWRPSRSSRRGILSLSGALWRLSRRHRGGRWIRGRERRRSTGRGRLFIGVDARRRRDRRGGEAIVDVGTS